MGEHLNKEIESSTIANERENSLHFYQKREIKKSRTIFYSSIVIFSSDCWYYKLLLGTISKSSHGVARVQWIKKRAFLHDNNTVTNQKVMLFFIVWNIHIEEQWGSYLFSWFHLKFNKILLYIFLDYQDYVIPSLTDTLI